jgi:tetraacyldisaccharide 4'-kinase
MLYGSIMAFRNFLFDRGILKSTEFLVTTISVGNLAVGGTGKTPHVEYLIRLLGNKYKVAVLSRGYGRKTKGYMEADDDSDASKIGDEPYLYHRKFPFIKVVVGEKRVDAIKKLLQKHRDIKVVLLDDAYQHRYLKADLQILLTEYSNLYVDDLPMPAGRLREFPRGSKRANLIIVSKCPKNLSWEEAGRIREKLAPEPEQEVFFTRYSYDKPLAAWKDDIEFTDTEPVVVTGIANPAPMITYLEKRFPKLEHMEYPDHYSFNRNDIKKIRRECRDGKTRHQLLTTEKDGMRLYPHKKKLKGIDVFVLPIKVKFLFREKAFDERILQYLNERLSLQA